MKRGCSGMRERRTEGKGNGEESAARREYEVVGRGGG